MRKIALVLGICGVFTAVGYTVCAETSDSDKELGEIAELKKQMSSLDERIKSLEKRLDDGVIVMLTPPGDPNAADFNIPVIQSRPQRLPRGSIRREFNGMPFYIVPITNAK